MKTIEEHLIETASELFYKQGYSLTGINEVIKEANIAKATLYNYYKSKDELCVEFLRYMYINTKKRKNRCWLFSIF